MADFNIDVKDPGYQGVPSMVPRIKDDTLQRSLADLVSSAVQQAAGKLMKDKDKFPEEALKEFRIGAEQSAQIDSAPLDSTVRQDYGQTKVAAERQSLKEAYNQKLEQAKQGILNQEDVLKATQEFNKSMKTLDAKAQQIGNQFNYKQGVFNVYDRIAEKYGDSVAAKVFETMHGGHPIEFMTKDLVEANQLAKAKAEEARAKTLNEYAATYGMQMHPGESQADYAERTFDFVGKMQAARSYSEQVNVLKQGIASGEIDDANGAATKRIKYLQQQLVPSLTTAQTSGFNQIMATNVPTNSGQRVALQSKLQDYYNSELQSIYSNLTDNPEAQTAAKKALDDRYTFYQDMASGKTAMNTADYQTKLNVLQKLEQMQSQIPTFKTMQVLDQFRGLIATMDGLQTAEFSKMISETGGQEIMRYLVGEGGESNAINQVSPQDFNKFVGRWASLASKNPQFASLMATPSMKLFQASFDPYTGAIKNPAAMTGVLTLFGSREFLQYMYPVAKQQYGSLGMQNIYNQAVTEVGKIVQMNLDNSPTVKEALKGTEVGGDKSLVLEIDKTSGEVLLGVQDGSGKMRLLPNQDSDPNIRRYRAGVGASIRSLAHFKGSTRYEDYAGVLLQQIGTSGAGNTRVMTKEQFEAERKKSENMP